MYICIGIHTNIIYVDVKVYINKYNSPDSHQSIKNNFVLYGLYLQQYVTRFEYFINVCKVLAILFSVSITAVLPICETSCNILLVFIVRQNVVHIPLGSTGIEWYP